ncbi:MAG: hypothetical protein JKX85_07740 [Phycisphaeraceae bacterium]|nr:hypothetical protein [Phycisphaeraceae bacterium]
MFTFFFIFFILLIASGILFGTFIFHHSDEQRPKRLLRHAEAKGYGFEESGLAQLHSWNQRSPIFQTGDNRQIMNVVYGPYRDVEFSLFDYMFQHGEQTISTSVLAFDLKNKGMPRFSLWPQKMIPAQALLLPEEDCVPLNLDANNMQQHYRLHTASEGTARLLFCPKTTDYLTAHPDFFVEGSGNWIVLYQLNKRRQPAQIEDMIHAGYQMLRALRLNDSRVNFEDDTEDSDSVIEERNSSTEIKT